MRKFSRAWRADRVALVWAIAAFAALPFLCNTAKAQDGAAEAPPRHLQESWLDPEYVEFFGSVEFEGVGFAEDPAFEGQNRDAFSVAFEPTLLAEWRNGDLAFTLTPFFRWDDADDERTHFDLREAKVDYTQGDWQLTVGADFVFWGRTEAQQLVDIINTVDAVEDIDREDKLGQPMVRVTRFTEYGAFSGFYMPYFREVTFAGEGGRLRSSLPVGDDARFENDAGEWTPSVALRWAHVIGDFDFGLHGFHGVSRDPGLEPTRVDAFGAPTELTPVYGDISQIGFDGQYTTGPTLWKLEAIGRADQLDRNLRAQDYVGVTGGLEYTFFGIAETNWDLGLILEGSYDSRGDAALTPFNEDVIIGARLALNDEQDSEFLLTSAVDTESGGATLRVEAERRIIESWRASIEANAFLGIADTDIEASLADDSFIRLKLAYFF